MINDKRVLAIIPARGGSKGIYKKNIKLLHGKPLIQYTIDVAKASKYIDEVIVSTDCDEIAAVSKALNTRISMRPDYLSMDDSLVSDTVIYTMSELNKEGEKYDFILLLEPTSTLRTIKIIDTSIEKLLDVNVECVATYHETDVPPDRIWRLEENFAYTFFEGANPWLPRQKLEKGYQLNGLVYGIKMDIFSAMKNKDSLLTENITPILTENRLSVDIDSMIDFKLIELLMNENNE